MYGFQWMITALGNNNNVLVKKFRMTYKGKLKRQYPQGQLLKCGDPITPLITRGAQVDISSCTISRFLYGLDY